MLLGDALDRVVDPIGYGLAQTLRRVAHLSRVAGTAEGSRELRDEEINLATDGVRTLEIRPVQRFVELGSKVHQTRAILVPGARIEDVAQVGVAAKPLVRKILSARSDLRARQFRWSLLAKHREMGDVDSLFGMEQQILDVDEALQAANGDRGALVADAPDIALVGEDRALR